MVVEEVEEVADVVDGEIVVEKVVVTLAAEELVVVVEVVVVEVDVEEEGEEDGKLRKQQKAQHVKYEVHQKK